ncbi:MAG: hypothetical protein Kow0037_11420 [Calditrichia bacterium]
MQADRYICKIAYLSTVFVGKIAAHFIFENGELISIFKKTTGDRNGRQQPEALVFKEPATF